MAVVMHTEVLPDDPTGLRWVLPAGLPGTGRLLAAPGEFGALLADGRIVRAMAEPRALWIWQPPELDWSQTGAGVRDALIGALADPAGWSFEAAEDELLELVTRDVITRTLGPYIDSHGGQITFVRAAAGEVVLQLSGACAHCSVAGMTLHDRIQTTICERLDAAISVQEADGGCGERTGRPVWWPRLRR